MMAIRPLQQQRNCHSAAGSSGKNQRKRKSGTNKSLNSRTSSLEQNIDLSSTETEVNTVLLEKLLLLPDSTKSAAALVKHSVPKSSKPYYRKKFAAEFPSVNKSDDVDTASETCSRDDSCGYNFDTIKRLKDLNRFLSDKIDKNLNK